MAVPANYDAALHQFREQPKVIRLPHIQFLRYLIERGRLEHYPAGPPSGPVTGLIAEWGRRPW